MSNTPKSNYSTEDTLNSLRRAVHKALERKRKLGQYTVQWRANKIVINGRDMGSDPIVINDDN
ncbi:MAG TPA: hypothetical protein VIN66_16030 [Rheinheimera sp.]|uniref:hypothetical protein n=1 Tax=Rheinheimera sp. TaxID=1869214 RepID=UPI002F935A93